MIFSDEMRLLGNDWDGVHMKENGNVWRKSANGDCDECRPRWEEAWCDGGRGSRHELLARYYRGVVVCGWGKGRCLGNGEGN